MSKPSSCFACWNIQNRPAGQSEKSSPHVFLCPANNNCSLTTPRACSFTKMSFLAASWCNISSPFSRFTRLSIACGRSHSFSNSSKRRNTAAQMQGNQAGYPHLLRECEHHSDIFVDLTNGQNKTCDELAKQKVAKHYGIMFRYFRAQYVLKKLDEFAANVSWL